MNLFNKNPLVLLVDDDSTLLRGLERNLVARDLDVETASCAAEANAVLNHFNVDFIVCDYKMPGTSGLDFLDVAISKNKNLAAILLTGEVGDVPSAQGWADKIGVKIFRKPSDADEIASEIFRTLRARVKS